jgi:hypothetical protein
MRLTGAFLALLAVTILPCSSGCASKSPDEAKKELEKLKKKEKPKPPFDQLRVFAEPNERSFTDPKDLENQLAPRNAIKPGHWTGVLVEAKANTADFGGELTSEPRDNQQNLVDLEGSVFNFVLSRPASLAKGQKKTLESLFFAPPLDRSQAVVEETAPIDGSAPVVLRRTSTWMYNQLRSPQRGIESRVDPELLPHMPSFQYFMVVLARDPVRYRYLRVLDSVRPLGEAATTLAEDAAYYRTLFLRPNQPLALPSQPLCWTSAAVVVWDDILPSALTPDQQQSLVDWVHWGGALIVSGPQSLDALRGSFLEPYLPATGSETTELGAQAVAALNEHWTIAETNGEKSPLLPVKPWSGVKLVRSPSAEFVVGTGELVAERRVGRGRVLTTAFRLSEPDLINWRSFDSFFNACMLHRPRRSFNLTHDQFQFEGVRAADRFDSALTTGVRYFSRDAKEPEGAASGVASSNVPGEVPVATPPLPQSQPPAVQPVPGLIAGLSGDLPEANSDVDVIEALRARPGVAAWNDFSKVSKTAGHALREAAGIAVPKREFVLWMVGLYLLLIVPVNWLVFRLLGRVEWAWFAVPVVALAWGAVVIWLAQLDIGFARAETEISVLEVQADFPRAHLSRYTALYSSLSTSYSVRFDERSAVAQPFAVDLTQLSGQRHSTVMFRNAAEQVLSDFLVSSNSTGMVHSEQMIDLGGGLAWQPDTEGGASLENNTKLKLSGVAIVRRRRDNQGQAVAESAWLGDLIVGARVDVQFEPHDPAALAEARDRAPLSTHDRSEGSLSLRALLDFAESHATLELGDVRLVAWQDQPLRGVHIEPAAPQARRATLVVANLQFAPTAQPAPDLNLRLQREPIREEKSNAAKTEAAGPNP